MRCPALKDLPPPPAGKTGWPWTEETPPLPDRAPDGNPWPRVSLVMPVRNGVRWVEESIRSCLLQGYPDLEMIVFDACSTDGTVDVIRRYAPWLAHWASEPDRGQSHAINKGLARATGRFFNWHNADDMLALGSLRETVTAFIQHPRADYVHGYPVFIDEAGAFLRQGRDPAWQERAGRLADAVWCVAHLKVGAQPGSLMDADLLKKLGGLREDLHYAMDKEVFLRLTLERSSWYIDAPVVFFRTHVRAKTWGASAERAPEMLRIVRPIFRRKDLRPEIALMKDRALAKAHLYAWQYYRASGFRLRARWHDLCERACSAPNGWRRWAAFLKGIAAGPRP